MGIHPPGRPDLLKAGKEGKVCEIITQKAEELGLSGPEFFLVPEKGGFWRSL